LLEPLGIFVVKVLLLEVLLVNPRNRAPTLMIGLLLQMLREDHRVAELVAGGL
jgi:hypothetical protein